MASSAGDAIPKDKKFIGAVKDEWQLYSDNFSDYTVGPPIGFGASSTVYAAQFQPPGAPHPIPCALKVLDLDRLPPHSLRLLQRETQLMSLSKHPNVLRVRGTWMDGHKLYIAMRLMNAGSVADAMRYGWPGGMEEDVVKCILKQALEGINYLHINGLIHRDVKAANLLIDDDGTVLLGDLGVAAFLWDAEDTPPPPAFPSAQKRTVNFSTTTTAAASRPNLAHTGKLGKRKSFVGTPCWMAPEVINGKQYDASADIWSFGITALELTQGRAPRSREATAKALLQTVQEAPPQLERNGGPHRYSRAFQEVVARCLDKDPAARPSAEALLQTPFFRSAKRKAFLVNTLLRGLPPLTQRQERRKLPSVIGGSTMDSWDFSSVGNSPTASVHSRHQRSILSILPADGAFEVEDGDDVDADGGDEDEEGNGSSSEDMTEDVRPDTSVVSRPASPLHSRSVSWSDNPETHVVADAMTGALVSPARNISHPLSIADSTSNSSSSKSHDKSSFESSSATELWASPRNSPPSNKLWKKLTTRFERQI